MIVTEEKVSTGRKMSVCHEDGMCSLEFRTQLRNSVLFPAMQSKQHHLAPCPKQHNVSAPTVHHRHISFEHCKYLTTRGQTQRSANNKQTDCTVQHSLYPVQHISISIESCSKTHMSIAWLYNISTHMCIATGYGLDGPGIESRWGRNFSYLSRQALGPIQPPVQWVPGLSGG
jgi:hypothetical protein